MKKLLLFFKNAPWYVAYPFVLIFFGIKFLTTKSKFKKYVKSPEDFLEDEKYNIIYKLTRPVSFLLKIKNSDIIKESSIAKKNQLIICNHRSFVDSLILFNFLYEQLGPHFVFIAKKELESSKIGFALKFIDTVFIDRDNIRQMVNSIEIQKDIITKQHKSIVIFPEGTRNTSEILLDFKSGAFEIAYKTMVPIQPIVFVNTEDYWEQRKTKTDKRLIKMIVLPPYQPNKFLHINRQIFSTNVQKSMQAEISKEFHTKKPEKTNKK